MAGVTGRSGGKREGAGRKAKEPTYIPPDQAAVVSGEPLDPRPTLELVALGHIEVTPNQMKALTALLPYVHTKKGDGGKKDEQGDAAKKAGAGKFAAAAPPLKLVGKR
jgi:phage terminase small subunit